MNENAKDKKPVDDADIAKMTAAQDNADANTVLPDDGSLEAVLADAIEAAPPADAEGEEGADIEGAIDPYDQLLAERDALKDQLLRALAESENTRRRSERDVQGAKKYGHTGLARDLVGAIDNLARALDIMKADDFETGSLSEAMTNVLTGIELSWTEIMTITEKHGIKQINPKGEKFDYNFHHAMFEVPPPKPRPGWSLKSCNMVMFCMTVCCVLPWWAYRRHLMLLPQLMTARPTTRPKREMPKEMVMQQARTHDVLFSRDHLINLRIAPIG